MVRFAVYILMAVLTVPGALRACDLALLLAVDVSGSVDREEYRVQMQGLADGLRDGIVMDALVARKARVALVQWTGTTRQELSIDWSEIQSHEDVDDLAMRVETAPRPWRNYSTAIGEVMALAHPLFARVKDCRRKVMDISGDGISNEGIDPASPRGALARNGITVNALVIDAANEDLTAWFWENVITGEGAFVITANGFKDYPRAIRRKLIRETAKTVACLDRCAFTPARDM